MRHKCALIWSLLPVVLVLTGCGGIRASKSISPLDFFLPGLIQAEPRPAPAEPAAPLDEPTRPVVQVN